MACDFCSETNFCLGDDPGFGPCVCCTPANMAAMADNQRGHDDALEVLGQAWEHFAAYVTRLGMNPRAVKLQDPDLDALMALLGD